MAADITPEQLANDPEYRLHRRFDRFGRLYGDAAVSQLMQSRVAIFGLGGVGSFAAEAIARSAIGHITLVDFDEVCVTNLNRQLQALKSTVGRPKAEVLAERLREINPRLHVEPIHEFYGEKTSDRLLGADGRTFDFVIDCIDNISAKVHLIATCRERDIPIVSSMGAAAKIDPTRLEIADLAETKVCPFARDVRKLLRQKHGFAAEGPMGVAAVFSREPRNWPKQLTYDRGLGFRCICPNHHPEHTCERRTLIDGTAVFVTGAFGLACASHVINTLTASLRDEAPRAASILAER